MDKAVIYEVTSKNDPNCIEWHFLFDGEHFALSGTENHRAQLLKNVLFSLSSLLLSGKKEDFHVYFFLKISREEFDSMTV